MSSEPDEVHLARSAGSNRPRPARAVRTSGASSRRRPPLNACATPCRRPRTTEPARTSCSSTPPSSHRSSCPSPSRTTKISSSSEWQCGGAFSLPGKDLCVADAGLDRARLAPGEPDPAADGRPVALVCLEIGDVDDRATGEARARRPRAGRRQPRAPTDDPPPRRPAPRSRRATPRRPAGAR